MATPLERQEFTRRRFLTIVGAVAGLPLIGTASAAPATLRWQGTALGAQASLSLRGADPDRTGAAIHAVIDEVDRLESIFSLYRPNSELVRLNRDGTLANPSLELVDLLSTARRVSELTEGAFDVTVQPLWQLYAAGKSDPAAIARSLKVVGFDGIRMGSDEITLTRPGAEITLNGIAQGYITDRVAALLKAEGFDNVLVNMGEIRAVGSDPWQVSTPSARTVTLSDRAVATSSRQGLTFDAQGRYHHIFDPRTGQSTRDIETVSVVANSATIADALSTALMIGDIDRLRDRLTEFGRLEITAT
jgi:FAD:protein FMN transferase